jgi:hypothetical protein
MFKRKEVKMEEKEVKVSEILKVGEIPRVEVRNAVDEEGNNLTFITIEEALSEILTRVRRMDKAL